MSNDKDKLHKVYITIEAVISSPEYDSIDSIIDEFGSESHYSIPDTPNVKVHTTQWLDTSTCNPIY